MFPDPIRGGLNGLICHAVSPCLLFRFSAVTAPIIVAIKVSFFTRKVNRHGQGDGSNVIKLRILALYHQSVRSRLFPGDSEKCSFSGGFHRNINWFLRKNPRILGIISDFMGNLTSKIGDLPPGFERKL